MDWMPLAKKSLPEYIEKTTKILKIPTLLTKYDSSNVEAPFGENIRKALDCVLEMGKADGFTVKDIDHYAGVIEMGDGDETLAILGHLDVVPATGNWDDDPFSAVMKNNRIYARGSMDDKGPSMAAYLAMKMVRDAGIPLHKKVRLILGCDEESGMRCIERYLEKEGMPDLGFSPDAEFPLIHGEKGNTSFDITGQYQDALLLAFTAGERYNIVPDYAEVSLSKDLKKEFQAYLKSHQYEGQAIDNRLIIRGKSAHGAMPEDGINAIYLMADFLKDHTKHPLIDFINRFLAFDVKGRKLGIDHVDAVMKELTLNVAIIQLDKEYYRLGCNIRYPRGYDPIEGAKRISACASSCQSEYVFLEDSPVHFVDPNHPIVQTLYQAYQKYSGDEHSPVMTIGGGTYARHLKFGVAFGAQFPGSPDLVHKPNEYLDLDEMTTTMAIFAESIAKLAGSK
ncbi:MAG: dipeptidase PepV [Candidatus Izemoplasmatales bacterium]|jgi:succinyl-diaminopimelate desuccinylase|nr:dipeptidase PepV [Candidatus Izemoplasmatales bacterium]MDD4354430.1 dipeptidase PepV [Candidatus Izemoplasmatales bacterium]MDD4988681.1 dipeptidase PepV [Candidatus Izemoplasmatales bacterium]MDD5601423.1 dipeptidase PepV [Candidatus Izemoplasmatales bacterium]MDY0372710.1 dipeptidase PepV [Candidatus Izemoplasmatales bacterium]